ncbi:MAG: AAA family ATPase [Candidatus Bathyarchaeia archaeon]
MHNGAKRGLIITVGGPHGTGKSTYAKALAEALGLRYVCAGELFRDLAKERHLSLEAFSSLAAKDPTIDKMIDDRTKAEARKGGLVIDAQLGAWMINGLADAKLLMVAPDEVRFKRIADRDGISLESARKETVAREEIQKERYKKYYGINVDDLSIYDLKIDTSLHSVEQTKSLVIAEVRKLVAKKRT